jgi:hypothetical protein
MIEVIGGIARVVSDLFVLAAIEGKDDKNYIWDSHPLLGWFRD